jgi:hypothetical protein
MRVVSYAITYAMAREKQLGASRLHVSESAYESPYDSMHDLYANRIGIQFFFLLPFTMFCSNISATKHQKLLAAITYFGSKSYTESYGDSYGKSHLRRHAGSAIADGKTDQSAFLRIADETTDAKSARGNDPFFF